MNIIYIHGINTKNNKFYVEWNSKVKNILNDFCEELSEITETDIKLVMTAIPFKWESRSWIEDLQKIALSKFFRDKIINSLKELISIDSPYKKDHTIIISHSFGAVWVYKAVMRLLKEKKLSNNLSSIMLGGALGGTNLPFGGVYVKALREKESLPKVPPNFDIWYNFYNPDEYVSTKLFIPGVKNIKIDIKDFDPGLDEHDANYYIDHPEFEKALKEIIDLVIKKKYSTTQPVK